MNKKTLTQIRKTMNKIDKNLEIVNDTFIELENLFNKLEEETELEKKNE